MKAHYVSLAFADESGRARSITMRTSRRVVTAPLIREAIAELDMTENASLLSVSWLGRMTSSEYTEGVKRRRHVLTGLRSIAVFATCLLIQITVLVYFLK